MTAKSDDVYAGISSEAVRAKTGQGWAEWFALLDRAGAAAWPHKEIAAHLREAGCGPWWGQMVAVGYEQARGLRVKHQTADGFSANASRTVNVPVDRLFAAWSEPRTRAKWLPDAKGITIRKATANKSMRITWGDGESSIEVNFYPKGAKSQVTVERRKLAGEKEVNQVKAYWSAALDQLQALLESAATPPRKKVLNAVRKK